MGSRRRWAVLPGSVLEGLSEEEREGLRREFWETFVRRTGLSAAFLAGIGFLLLISVDVLDVFGFDPEQQRATVVVHLAMMAAGVSYLPTYLRGLRGSTPLHQGPARVRAVVFWFFALLVSDAMFYLGIAFIDTTAPLVVGTFVFGVALLFPGPLGFLLPAINGVALLAAATHVIPAERLSSHLVPAAGALLGTWLLARMEVETRASDYRNRLTIERQSRELAAAKERLERQNDELARLHRAQGELLGIAAHDLKNPLGAIAGYAEILLEKPEPEPEQRESATRRIVCLAQRMVALIRDLLDVQRIEAGRIDCAVEEVDLFAAASQVVESQRRAAEAKEQVLRLVEAGVPIRAAADPAKLHQVLENLISNALKFSPRGAEVSVVVTRQDGGARCEVSDQGPGLTEEERQRVFDAFARLRARPTGGEGSTGLGLSIVKRLTEAMSGRVSCTSEPGKGSTFAVDLPLAGAGRN